MEKRGEEREFRDWFDRNLGVQINKSVKSWNPTYCKSYISTKENGDLLILMIKSEDLNGVDKSQNYCR